ncbi:formaldehyde dehydrogenase [Fusarium heterosporum]|uniref:Formaldehyde dehydrogenase n=1 Tax=Fusarium heterosporum TaxID=42747 RepID=A0A8H5WLK1_FUSHE|nr:formaldehyde dehydrogenase [Fusarium heterosporum]
MSQIQTMKAVVFDGPYKISVQERPVPQIQSPDDVVVKVNMTALCGSELHLFRGVEPTEPDFIMGHEFTGTVVSLGSAVKSVKVGDKIVCPFTASCGRCYFCLNGGSARCVNSQPLGSPKLDGAQAEYVRIPFADGTIIKAPEGIHDQALILMADIFPTGYFGVQSGVEMMPKLALQEATIVVVGCGPVGLCATVAAAALKPKHLFAVDSVQSRLDQAAKIGAEPLNFMEDRDGMIERVKAVTDGRGADIVVEVVGLSPALRTAFDLVRSFGAISSIGVHNAEIPWSGTDAYNKNVRLQMGRCPVRSIFHEAMEVLKQKQESLGFLFENILPLSDAVKGYELFNQSKVQKVIFQA